MTNNVQQEYINQKFSTTDESLKNIAKNVITLLRPALKMLSDSMNNFIKSYLATNPLTPHQKHIALHSKKLRIRKKYTNRLMKELLHNSGRIK